jgi:hypothetical protein
MNDAIRDFLASNAYESLSGRADAVAMGLLIALLVEQELLRAYALRSARPLLLPFNVAVAPLLLTFVLVVIVRALGLR